MRGIDSFFRRRNQATQQVLEQVLVQRVECVPVDLPAQSHRVVDGGLNDAATAVVRFDLELQPGPARQLHLGDEAHRAVRFDGFDAPEIDRVSHAQAARVSATASHADAAGQKIESSAKVPEPVGIVPPGRAADGLDRGESGSRRAFG